MLGENFDFSPARGTFHNLFPHVASRKNALEIFGLSILLSSKLVSRKSWASVIVACLLALEVKRGPQKCITSPLLSASA
ncbi:hypothetical protein HKBW3S33_01982 [Candidatus Hakubella thermalkaliphila]|uniref:Uncharacterized protein n=1 Tax=Candidatus Hakubella thermalkaliphila TaxID=2754717 RepID=A0A6V8P898_9ACTN|nr:hypothetical protein HKBW3S33_01982 [Candidatus Hakubella thermalkaliphila]